MTQAEDVAVLRNLKCGHVVGVTLTSHVTALYRWLVARDEGGWAVQTVPNTREVWASMMEGEPCRTCRRSS